MLFYGTIGDLLQVHNLMLFFFNFARQDNVEMRNTDLMLINVNVLNHLTQYVNDIFF